MGSTQSKWFRFLIAMIKAVVITVLAAVVLSFSAVGFRKYAGIHIPFGFVLGLIIGVAGGVGGHLGNKWKRENLQYKV
jgi:hypothetical protein